MNIAYVGDITNHGVSLPTFGTSMLILLSRLDDIHSIDVYCPFRTNNDIDFNYPKITIHEKYTSKSTMSYVSLYSVDWGRYDNYESKKTLLYETRL